MPASRLTYFVYKRKASDWYHKFTIPKRNGTARDIAAPFGPLLTMQRKIGAALSDLYHADSAVHGFVKERSILTGARHHCGRALVFNVDLEGFFPSINFGRVRAVLMAPPFRLPPPVATTLARIVTLDNALPQGAPSSPVLSNIMCRGLDWRLGKLAFSHGCVYTRYADDLTFSTRRPGFPKELVTLAQGEDPRQAAVGPELQGCITSAGFKVNALKVRLQTSRIRQQVTGLTVNAFPNVRRELVRQVRSMLHAWEKFGLERADEEYRTRYCQPRRRSGCKQGVFKDVVRGKIDFVRQVRGTECAMYRRLWRRYVALDPAAEKRIAAAPQGAAPGARTLFLSHASEDKVAIVRPVAAELKRLGISYWLDEAELVVGDRLALKVNEGIANSRYAVIFWSQSFVQRRWPMAELNGLLCREYDSGETVVLPILIGSESEAKALRREFPLLGGTVFARWRGSATEVARLLAEHVGRARPA